MCARFIFYGSQAKSPIRNLEELNVIEVLPSPYFPSARERETQNSMSENVSACSMSNGDISCSFNQNKAEWSIDEASLGFGMRRRHRCFVVTARARSFLYHQVDFMLLLYISLVDLFLIFGTR